jgi:hypothetical protein
LTQLQKKRAKCHYCQKIDEDLVVHLKTSHGLGLGGELPEIIADMMIKIEQLQNQVDRLHRETLVNTGMESNE